MILDHRQILSQNLGCEPEAVVDTLFPISKGFTEKERISNIAAIYASMGYVYRRTKRNFR